MTAVNPRPPITANVDGVWSVFAADIDGDGDGDGDGDQDVPSASFPERYDRFVREDEGVDSFHSAIPAASVDTSATIANQVVIVRGIHEPLSAELGPILYLPFDDSINDVSATAQDIDYVGTGEAVFVPGVSGQALRFDGHSQYLVLSSVGQLIEGRDFSFSAWVRVHGYSDAHPSIFAQNDDQLGYVTHNISIRNNGNLIYDNWLPWSERSLVQNVVQTGEWMHVGIVRQDDAIKIFVNGELEHEGAAERLSSSSTIDRTLLGARFYHDSANNFFQGDMDEVMIYDRSLSDDEVRSLADLASDASSVNIVDDAEGDAEDTVDILSAEITREGDVVSVALAMHSIPDIVELCDDDWVPCFTHPQRLR